MDIRLPFLFFLFFSLLKTANVTSNFFPITYSEKEVLYNTIHTCKNDKKKREQRRRLTPETSCYLRIKG